MLSSNVSLPSPLFLTIYYWFSQISFILTWLISPFLFYIILTQSKGLKNYKWFILNHSFWSFAFETILGLFKPVLLLPFFAGFPLSGIREIGSYHVTAIATILGFIFGINYAAALCVTIAMRYITIFRSPLTNWITRKLIIAVVFIITLCLYPLIIIAAISALSTDQNSIHEEAMSCDDYFKSFQEPSLVFVSLTKVKTILILVLIILILILIFGIFIIFIFKHLVRKNATVSVSKIQRSMVISSVVQIMLSLLFLDLPISSLIVFILLDIPHTSIYACICVAFISMHTILEFIATFYFVLPYRKFIQKQFFSFFKAHKTPRISVVEILSKINRNSQVSNRL